jgi:hypothetical protein
LFVCDACLSVAPVLIRWRVRSARASKIKIGDFLRDRTDGC